MRPLIDEPGLDVKDPRAIALWRSSCDGQRAVLVGECPNEATANLPDLWLRPDDDRRKMHAGNRLMWLLRHAHPGATVDDFLRSFRRTNLRAAAAGGWKQHQAREDAVQLARTLARDVGLPVVLLGRRVQQAFGAAPRPFYWHRLPEAEELMVATFPHPSGRSHVWNQGNVVQKAAGFLSALVLPREERAW